MNTYQEEILSMSKFRISLIQKIEEAEEKENGPDTKTAELKADDLTKEIIDSIKTYFDRLPIDFILEELSKLGWCPNLLNDDNGHWAISTDGFQSVSFNDHPEDVETSFFIEANCWKDTIREALKYYLTQDE